MEDIVIEKYLTDLKALCNVCKKRNKCNGDKVCTLKKLVFKIAKSKYERREHESI